MPSYSGGATGALSGAGTGAMIGSFVPGIGTAIGAGVGGLVGGLSGLFSGNDNKLKKIPTLSKEQQAILGNVYGNLSGAQGGYGNAMGLLQGYLDPNSEQYKNFEAPYLREFEQQTIPGLAERFAGAGAQGGALSSSGFGQALGSAGANLQTNLAAMKSQMQRQSISDILNQYNQLTSTGLNAQPFAYGIQPGGAGALPSAFANMSGPLAQYGLGQMMNQQQQPQQGYQQQFPLTNYYD